MFVKVVRKNVGEEKCSIDSIYECHRVHIHWTHGREPLSLDLQMNSDESYAGGVYGITVDWPEPAMIYIMSEEGRTVDKIEHKGWPTTPPGPATPPVVEGHNPQG